MLIILTFPPAFTLLMGHAFEITALTHVPTILRDEDQSAESRQFSDFLATKQTFDLKRESPEAPLFDLLHAGVEARIIIPKGWGKGLNDGEPIPLRVILDGSDTNTATELEGLLEQALGDFQLQARDAMIENLPEEMIRAWKKDPGRFPQQGRLVHDAMESRAADRL